MALLPHPHNSSIRSTPSRAPLNTSSTRPRSAHRIRKQNPHFELICRGTAISLCSTPAAISRLSAPNAPCTDSNSTTP